MKNDELKTAYHLYYQPLFYYALSLTKSPSDAEDLVANTFIKALLSFEDGSLKQWLFKVLKNEFYRWYQKRKRVIDENSFDFTKILDTTNIHQDLIAKEKKQWLYQQIAKLSSKEQEIMYLSLILELKDEDIASIMHLSEQNIRVIRHRIKNKLAQQKRKEWQE